jgi:hypothetical protein
MLIVVALIFGNLLWQVVKDIRQAEGEQKTKKIWIYSGICAGCFIFYAGLRIFAKEPLSDLYFWLSGIK